MFTNIFKNIRESILTKIISMLNIILLVIFLGGIIIFYISTRPVMTIIAKFSRLTPVSEGISVYYNGYKVGKINKIDLSEDSKFAYVYLGIYKKGLKLPTNTVAKVEITKEKSINYIDLIYPTKPSGKFLHDQSIIKGILSQNINSFLESQIEKGSLNFGSAEISNTAENIDILAKKHTKLAEVITDMLLENRKDIRKLINSSAKAAVHIDNITKGLDKSVNDPDIQANLKEIVVSKAKTSKNMENITKSLDKLVNDPDIPVNLKKIVVSTAKTSKNIENLSSDKKLGQIIINMSETSENFNKTGLNMKNSTDDIKTTVDKVNKVLDQINCTTKSIENLANGASEILSKRFLIFKLMFGKPGNSLEKPQQCCPAEK